MLKVETELAKLSRFVLIKEVIFSSFTDLKRL